MVNRKWKDPALIAELRAKYRELRSIRKAADAVGLSYSSAHGVLVRAGELLADRGTPSGKVRTMADLAATDHVVRMILLALRDNGPMTALDVTASGSQSSSRRAYLGRLEHDGYIGALAPKEPPYVYALTGKGREMLATADEEYRKCSPEELRRRANAGESQKDIAESLGVSAGVVSRRISGRARASRRNTASDD